MINFKNKLLFFIILTFIIKSHLLYAQPDKNSLKILNIIEKIDHNLKQTNYQHNTIVREKTGIYLWDCSGMVNWILKRSFPKAYYSIGIDRPVARDYYFKIKSSPINRFSKGWMRLKHIKEAAPGDLFAWVRPPNFPSKNTGHVGFVLEQPQLVQRNPEAYLLKISDATTIPHQNDSRTDNEMTGFGIGSIMFITDNNGTPTEYCWYGTDTYGCIPTKIVFGRAGY